MKLNHLQALSVLVSAQECLHDGPKKSEQKRPYLNHGHVALSKALKTIGNQDGWVENLGDVGESLKAWNAAIIHDLGGEQQVSAMELSVIELACKTHLLLASIDRFLLPNQSDRGPLD